MIKEAWVSPETKVQQFMANEYVAACWKIKCNVPTGFGFDDANGNGKYDRGETKYTWDGSYGCGEYHNGVQGDSGPVANAMWQPQTISWGGYSNYGPAYEVYKFNTGKHDPHFSKVEDAEWETNPNAS